MDHADRLENDHLSLIERTLGAVIGDTLSLRLAVEYQRDARRAWASCSQGRKMVALLRFVDARLSLRLLCDAIEDAVRGDGTCVRTFELLRKWCDDPADDTAAASISDAATRMTNEPSSRRDAPARVVWLLLCIVQDLSDGVVDAGDFDYAAHCAAWLDGDPHRYYARDAGLAQAVREACPHPPPFEAFTRKDES